MDKKAYFAITLTALLLLGFLTTSLVSYFVAEGEDLSTLARRADAALYSAKRQGRNPVVQA